MEAYIERATGFLGRVSLSPQHQDGQGKESRGLDDGTGVRNGEEKHPQGQTQEGECAEEVMAEGMGGGG